MQVTRPYHQNWIVSQAAEMRAELLTRRLRGVTDPEKRLNIRIEIRLMNYNELRAALGA